MNNLEKNGGPLLVKPFSSQHEINSNLTPEEAFFLNKNLTNYSTICLNREGKNNKQHLHYFKKHVTRYGKVIFLGATCCKMLGIEYNEWGKNSAGWCVPPLNRIMGSKTNTRKFLEIVR